MYRLFRSQTPLFSILKYHIHYHTSREVWPSDEPLKQNWPKSLLFLTPPEKKQGKYATTAILMSIMNYEEVRSWNTIHDESQERAYRAFKEQKARQMIEVFSGKFPELKKAIVVMETSTPLTWQKYTGTPQGSVYGVMRDAASPEKTTIYPRTKIPGLLLTGQNVNLHGALGVTIGAIMTCGEIFGLPHVLKKINDVS